MAELETSPEQRQAVTAVDPHELHVRLAAAESQLREQAAELARLREEIEQLTGTAPAEERAPAADRRPARQVEIVRLDALPPRESWLHRCEGFSVELPDGTVGTVEEIRYGSRYDRPDRLAVRVGRWRPQLVLVSTDEVEDIDPEEELVLLCRAAERESGRPATHGRPAASPLDFLTRGLRSWTRRSDAS